MIMHNFVLCDILNLQEEWVPVLKSNDIAAGDLVPVEVDGLAILVAADLDGKIFAIANSCPHLGTPLENGRYKNLAYNHC